MNRWVKALLKNLDDYVDENTKIRVMEGVGESCPFTHLNDEKLIVLKANAIDEKDFLNRLAEQWRVVMEGNDVFVVFDQCYCPMVNQDIKGVSETMCYCTMGNIKRKFRIGLDREVGVKMEKTIIAGDGECRFRILI